MEGSSGSPPAGAPSPAASELARVRADLQEQAAQLRALFESALAPAEAWNQFANQLRANAEQLQVESKAWAALQAQLRNAVVHPVEASQRNSDAWLARQREALEAFRLVWLGRKHGIAREFVANVRSVPVEERKSYGVDANRLRDQAEATVKDLEAPLVERERQLRQVVTDVTLPGRPPRLGSLHPVTLVQQEIEEIFAGLGYSVAEGPEVEDDFHNFEALNMPADHPARDAQDTFFVEGGWVLRTHTSPVQIRTMLARKPPIRVICPGRVFRFDNDLRHSPMFHQVECLAVAEGITFGHLKGTLEAFLQRLFTPETQVRLRPSYFPFTEPSAEVDVTCTACRGAGCPTCSHTGWMEILGSGMVDPRVLRKCGIDPAVYSGFAFGLGLDRVAMIRYGISNIRLLFDNDERLLRQVR